MLKEFRADLHIHTCLSPCADLDMTPSSIVKTACEKKLDIIAVTDHNSAENTAAARRAAEGTGLTVLAGMEITSSEEAHILAVFDDIEGIMKLQDKVYESMLPAEDIRPSSPFDTGGPGGFGEQVVVNEKDEVLGFNNRLLIGATGLPADSIVHTIHSLGGLAVASHVDREAFSIISQLGFIPGDLKFDALEISARADRKNAEYLFENYKSFTWVSSSDAHYIKDIGRAATVFLIKEPTTAEMALAMKGIDGRSVKPPQL
ncbi:MAG: PHP domain-containing protein [Deferribacteres bacterium]|nr:PHP domain-containing protein [Deferribacteres bacterium]